MKLKKLITPEDFKIEILNLCTRMYVHVCAITILAHV